MPAYYEVIYETGEHSIMFAQNDTEALEGIKGQHERALQGALGGPAGTQWPATRIKRVLVYDQHPSTTYESGTVEVALVESWFKKAVEVNRMGDLISVNMLIHDLREELEPLVTSDPHESNYKMKESRELKEAQWQ